MFLDSVFINAVRDYQYLLENNYSSKNIIKMVGDRYKLDTIQRSFLYRGITTNKLAKSRIDKLVNEKALENNVLHIDTYNLLITIQSYLKGKPVFISCDGFLRDAGEFKAKVSKNISFDRSIDLIFRYINAFQISFLKFYLDKNVSINNEVAEQIKQSLKEYTKQGEVSILNDVDMELIKEKSGILVTSDSEIIDQASLPFYDLAKNTLKYHFNVHFINLQQINKT